MRCMYDGFMGRGQEDLARTQRNWWVSVTSHLGPRNVWLWNPAGLARQRDGYALIGYVVVRTGVDLRGHCGRSRSWNTAVSLDIGIIAGLKQPARSSLEAFLHYKLMMNRNLACLSLGASGHQSMRQMKPCDDSRVVKSSANHCFLCWVSTFGNRKVQIIKCGPKVPLTSKLKPVMFGIIIFWGVYNKLKEWLVCLSWWSVSTRRQILSSL